jgi:hypothetical protein
MQLIFGVDGTETGPVAKKIAPFRDSLDKDDFAP